MASSLYDLLYACVVSVSIPAKKTKGTGFFVAPGKILTCAHVVESAQTNNVSIEVAWNGQTLPAQIQQCCDALYPDLALLQVDITNNPCVLLYGGAEPYNRLYSYGYPDLEPKGASTTFACEGWIDGEKKEILRFKEGQARPGMSGSPLLNWETGGVCGIVQSTRDRSSDLGGKAMLSKVIFREFPELEERQKQYHQQHREWVDILNAQQLQQISLEWIRFPATGAIKVFISYTRKDEAFQDDLMKHLTSMRREGLIKLWYDHDTEAGENEKEEAKKHLDTAGIILLLVSPNYLRSDYHYDVEMQEALERHKTGKVRVIPIILRDTEGWQNTEFSKLLSLPRDGKPVAKWQDRDDAFYNIAKEIRRVVEQMKKPQ
ncbi:MAG: hypothetical protein NVS4B7_00230 [Ktedonobacteraceae bacterium]